MFQNYKGMENFSAEEGDITIFRWKIFFSQCRKVLWGESFKVSEIFGHGKLYAEDGDITIFR